MEDWSWNGLVQRGRQGCRRRFLCNPDAAATPFCRHGLPESTAGMCHDCGKIGPTFIEFAQIWWSQPDK